MSSNVVLYFTSYFEEKMFLFPPSLSIYIGSANFACPSAGDATEPTNQPRELFAEEGGQFLHYTGTVVRTVWDGSCAETEKLLRSKGDGG